MINLFAYARTALWYGLQKLPMERGQKILVPDYICEAILHPLEELGIQTVFYPVDNRFVPDWEEINTIQTNEPAHAFLLVHYFGQPQDIERALEFCKKYDIWLIEDNAHGHGGKLKGRPLGSFGDLGFSSPRKHLQVPSGGMLYLHGKPFDVENNVLPVFPTSKSKELIRKMINTFPSVKARLRRMIRPEYDYSNPQNFPENRMGHFKADISSERIINNENWSKHSALRRKAWKTWSKFSLENGLKPVWENPHPESCPWVMPVYAPNPEERIRWLRKGWIKGDDMFPWPTLPEEIFLSSSSVQSRWRLLICFHLHQKQEDYK